MGRSRSSLCCALALIIHETIGRRDDALPESKTVLNGRGKKASPALSTTCVTRSYTHTWVFVGRQCTCWLDESRPRFTKPSDRLQVVDFKEIHFCRAPPPDPGSRCDVLEFSKEGKSIHNFKVRIRLRSENCVVSFAICLILVQQQCSEP